MPAAERNPTGMSARGPPTLNGVMGGLKYPLARRRMLHNTDARVLATIRHSRLLRIGSLSNSFNDGSMSNDTSTASGPRSPARV